MSRSLFQNDNTLPYVDESLEVRQDTPAKQNKDQGNKKNKLAVTSLILTCFAFLLCFTVIMPVISGAFSVAALTVAVRKGAKKLVPILSLSLSAVFAVGGTVLLGFLISLYTSDTEPRVPANYAIDAKTDIAYRITPTGTIPCDSNGVCNVTFEYIAMSNECSAQGGKVIQEALSGTTNNLIDYVEVPLPPVSQGEKGTLKLEFHSEPNDVIVATAAPEISC